MTEPPNRRPVSISLPIQWGDQDAFGHVNNIHFLRWFESARIAYLLKCEARVSNDGIGPILAAVHCNYRRQLKFPDIVAVTASVRAIGNSSITLEHEVWSQRLDCVAAEGESIVVMFDYRSQNKVPVSDAIRRKIEDVQGRDNGPEKRF